MRNLTVKVLVVLFAAITVNIQSVLAADVDNSQYVKPIVKITRESANNPYAYAPIAFAADLNGANTMDRNVYRNKNGDIVIDRFYVPDNY